MNNSPSWLYNEFQQVGKDYSSQAEVDVYDASHADFRDIEAESRQALDKLALRPTDTLIDFGSGTGIFALQAALRCAQVYAVDVSPTMIDLARTKAAQAGVSNIKFHLAGFLTYQHLGQPVDAITTTFAFHHLPDFWKGIALNRLSEMLKVGGQLYLHDVVIESTNALANINTFIRKQAAAGGDFLREDAEGHFRDEYSTYDWVLEGLLTRSGFAIASKQIEGGVIATYICTKN
jgi:cyclopropane fatty-acyl-phospholipid synthase-like methyltransferase